MTNKNEKNYEYHAVVLNDNFKDDVVTFDNEKAAEMYSNDKRRKGKMSYTYRAKKSKDIFEN